MPSDLSTSVAAGPHILVLGNEKGGTGKSTTAMHLIAGLLASGKQVGSIDLDARQATLTRYVENRQTFAERHGQSLRLPVHRTVPVSDFPNKSEADADELARFTSAMTDLAEMDAIVIDTPGRDSNLSKLGHSMAHILITPINDSFVDLDVIASVDPDTGRVRHPSKYAEMVFQQKIERARRDGSNRTFDWVVIRNRLSQLDSKNRKAMDAALEELAKRIGFRVAPGFSERVIFRELFLQGLTLLDIRDKDSGVRMNMSHLAARQELRALFQAIGLPGVV